MRGNEDGKSVMKLFFVMVFDFSVSVWCYGLEDGRVSKSFAAATACSTRVGGNRWRCYQRLVL